MATRIVRTHEALQLAGLEPLIWKGTIAHNLYPEAPQPDDDGLRSFDLDDIIALRLFREMLACGLTRAYAAMIASDIRTCLRAHPQLESVCVVKGHDAKGQPRPVVVVATPGDETLLMRFSIAKMRAALEVAFAGFAS